MAAIARDNPSIRDFVVGNEPNLNRFWMPQFAERRQRCRRVRVRGTAREDIRRAQGRLDADQRDRRCGLPARQRQPCRDQADAFADGVHHRSRAGLPRERPTAPDHGQLCESTPIRTTRACRLPSRIRTTRRSRSPTTASSSRCSGRRSTAPPRPARRCRSSTGSSASRRRSRSQKSTLYTGTEPASVKPVDIGTQGRFYRDALALAFCQPNVTTFMFFHAVDEGEPRPLAVRDLLRRRIGEVEPRRCRRRDARHARRRDREVPGALADAEGKGRLPEEPDGEDGAAQGSPDV